MRTWLITGVSSGLGNEMVKQILSQGDRVIGTVRNRRKVGDLLRQYADRFFVQMLDVTDVPAVHRMVSEAFEKYGKIDVVVSNAGYGLFGCAEELSDTEINHILATNLTGSIQFIRSAIPYMRLQGCGRIIQISSYGGQVAYPANSMYHATKFGIEGFCEAVSQEIRQFGIGMTIVEPGGARTEFRYGSAKVACLMPEYETCHGFLSMLDPANGLAPGNPAKMAACIIESIKQNPAPLRIVLGSAALKATIKCLEERLSSYKKQVDLAASTDIDCLDPNENV